MKNKTISSRSPIAKDLRSPKYRMRVVKNKKAYSRKTKHKSENVSSSFLFY